MASRRKAISVTTRFEVFKRDRFQCQYCGKHPPEVLLELDHVVPVAAGGGNESENLLTACQDCNRGKSDRLLNEGDIPAPSKATVAEMRERLKQAEVYAQLVADTRAHVECQIDRVNETWATAFGARIEQNGDRRTWVLSPGEQFPNERSLRIFAKRMALERILDAVDLVASRFDRASYHACLYFYGVCWRVIKGTSPQDQELPCADESVN